MKSRVKLYPTTFFIFLQLIPQPSHQLRICEVQSTCFKCDPQGRYSYFICRTSRDCFPEEYCNDKGFCCPMPSSLISMSESPDDSQIGTSTPEGHRCPDNSTTFDHRKCQNDADCLFREEICAEGKCCPSCKRRQVQEFKEVQKIDQLLPKMEFSLSLERMDSNNPVVSNIPQCTEDGRFYLPMQCSSGNWCFCVNQFGRRISESSSFQGNPLNCSRIREQNEKVFGKSSQENDIYEVAPPNFKSREIRRHPTLKGVSNEQQNLGESVERCTDPLREFKRCGSACPISCATRLAPRCPHREQCVKGCFCRLPYVLLDGTKPFNSMCVLPAECPMLSFHELNSWDGGFSPVASTFSEHNQQQDDRYKLQQPSTQPPPPLPLSEKCADPFKNFQTCGSACPMSCGRQYPTDCSTECISGCFCRVPYVLRNFSDPNSECVSPQKCASMLTQQSPAINRIANDEYICSREKNKAWTNCFSRRCSRECGQWPPFCYPDDCVPGCECIPPYVVIDKSASEWECVLPENCPREQVATAAGITNRPSITSNIVKTKTTTKATTTTSYPSDDFTKAKNKEVSNFEAECTDPKKEFRVCASSCPLGCDQTEFRQCTPCVSGCFCRNGFVFENASEWHNSTCVSISDCSPPPTTKHPNAVENDFETLSTTSTTTSLKFKATNLSAAESEPEEGNCPANAMDQNGRVCGNDLECGFKQKCCSSAPNTLRKCTCLDPNAIWLECGSVCPDHCGQKTSKRETCPKICRPGCFCAPGFVKYKRDMNSPCVPISKCSPSLDQPEDGNRQPPSHGLSTKSATDPVTNSNDNAIPEEERICDEALASAVLYAENGTRIGRLLARPDRRRGERRRMRLSGDLACDTTAEGCRNIGRALLLSVAEDQHGDLFSVSGTVTELQLKKSQEHSDRISVDRELIWPDPITPGTNPLIGHSVVLKAQKERQKDVIACAVLGIVPSC